MFRPVNRIDKDTVSYTHLTLQQGALTGLQELLDASRELDTVALVVLPLMVRGLSLIHI